MLDLCSGVYFIYCSFYFLQDSDSKSNHIVLTVDEHEFSDSRSGCLTHGKSSLYLLDRKLFRNY